MPDWARPGPATTGTPYPFSICVIRAIRSEFYFGAGFTAAFPRKALGKRVRCAKGPKSDRV
jgi:hypothetical protein